MAKAKPKPVPRAPAAAPSGAAAPGAVAQPDWPPTLTCVRCPPQGGARSLGAALRLPGEAVTHLRVSAHVAGFRRAGRAWSAEPVEVPIVEFDEAQIEQLLAEPMLIVVPVARGEEQ